MKITCGIDIIEIDRIKESIESLKDTFLNRVFTNNEIKYCESKKSMRYQHYAARFAAKEAVFKAISNVLENKFSISWQDIEILNDEMGRPKVYFTNKKMENLNCIDISLSHCKKYAVANVVALWEE